MSSKPTSASTSPLSGANFNPFAEHPFTRYSPSAPRTAPQPPRNPASSPTRQVPSHSHSSSPKHSPTGGTPTLSPGPVFVPYHPEAPPPDLSQVMKKQPSGWKLPGQ
ncbi:hypothetical protein R3P38DRAFT_2923089 [Favolaschia claudopus]|uniref:Uncharacterized protein n=1 Tax=Favolaschia claudopus TaxID=2862362 RepID=A0AAW0BYL5_9AGAR